MERFFARRTRRKTQIFFRVFCVVCGQSSNVQWRVRTSLPACERELAGDFFGDMRTSPSNKAVQRTRLLRFSWAMNLRFAQRPGGRVAELGRSTSDAR